MPLPNGTDRFMVSRRDHDSGHTKSRHWNVFDGRQMIETQSFALALDAQWVCDALNTCDRAEAAVKRYEAKVLAD